MGRSAKVFRVLCFAAAAAAALPLRAAEPLLVGAEFAYRVGRRDTLAAIGARFAVSPQALARRNRLSVSKPLVAGRTLRIDNRHIVPQVLEDGILINVPQRILYLFEDGRLAAWYPVALGQPGSWQTPTGSYRVVAKERDPTWEVPLSIQQEMKRRGERIRTKVAPGPENPLGNYWLGLSLTCCGIHGTNAPRSIYRFETHGCIRLAPEDAVDLFSRVSVGARVEIIYDTVLVARDERGRLFVEAHPDVYERRGGAYEKALDFAGNRDLRSASEAPGWEDALRIAEGIATPLPTSAGLSGTTAADRIRDSVAATRR
jgi:L,D-transpeptidase ErfK/SrfK